MTDQSIMRLGKLPRRHDPRTLKLARYMKSTLPPAPPGVNYTRGITDWGMMLNDQLGCCTIAAVGHAVQTWTANASSELIFPDPVILDYYRSWDGYNPADPSTDQGGVELDVLNDWRQQGFAGQALDAYAAIELGQRVYPTLPALDVMDAIWLCGGAYIGVELPLTAQDQDVWDITHDHSPDAQPGSWGGHALYLLAYDQDTLTCITWGQLKKMTWTWFSQYCSEAYALVSKDWLKASGVSPSGFDLAALEADLKLVTE